MFSFARHSKSKISNWWWTVDRPLLFALFALILAGVFLTFSASPGVAERIGVDMYYFIKRQLFFLVPATGLMLFMSFLSPKNVRRLAVLVFLASFVLLFLTLVKGSDIKGAKRWITIAGFSLQPSEFMKPAFAIVCAWILASGRLIKNFPAKEITTAVFGVILILLLLQPDLGMSITLSAIYGIELFLAGLPIFVIFLLGLLGILGLGGAYFMFDHVQSRIDRFLNPETGDMYQVSKSLEAFRNGGWFGLGPGEGIVKASLPDAHTDFIMAVVAEEFGFILCCLLLFIFAFIICRGFLLIMKETNLFTILAGAGLLMQFGVQVVINVSSTLHLIPTKGMTLPFISYGGSSLISIAFGMGALLSLTRLHPEKGDLE